MFPEFVVDPGLELDPDDPELEPDGEPELEGEPAADDEEVGVLAEEAPGTTVTTASAAAAAVGAISAVPIKKSHYTPGRTKNKG